MMNVSEITKEIIRREGGYVNDPDDPGGATKYGVTIGTMRRLNIDKNGDGRVSVADVKALTPGDAAEIYERFYFERPRIDELPVPLQASVYDMQVNAGANAVKILQRLMREFQEPVAVDGALGPQSIQAAQRVYDKAGVYLVDAYGIARRNYYFRLADRRRASRKYARARNGGKGGWIKRAEEFMRAEYRMTDDQFKRRVAAWG